MPCRHRRSRYVVVRTCDRSRRPHTMTYMYSTLFIFNNPTSPFDIVQIINSLNNTNSTGYDDVSTKILKIVSVIISPVLSYIINLCIVSGVFPNKLQFSIIKPLYKKNDRELINNYRPIALIPIFSKVLEKVIGKSLYQFFELNNIFTNKQAGFRKNKSINLAVYNFLHSIMTGLNNKHPHCIWI